MNRAQTKGAGNGTGPPRSMPKHKALGLMLGAAGLAIAVGPCTFLANFGQVEPLQGEPPAAEIDWAQLNPSDLPSGQ